MTRHNLGRGAFACLLAITFLTAIGNTGLISVMPTIGRVIGINDFLIASIFSLSALVWAVASPWWAVIANQRGRKPLIQLGIIGFIGSMLGCAIVLAAGLRGLIAPILTFALFFVVRSSYGFFGSAAATATQAYIGDRTDGQQRVSALSGMAGALSLGTIFGPAIAPFLIIAPFGLVGPMLGFALFAVGALLLSIWYIPADTSPEASGDAETRARDGSVRALWGDRMVGPLLNYGVVLSSVQAMNIYTLGFVVIDRLGRPPVEAQPSIGFAMVAGALAGLIAQWGMVPLLKLSPTSMMRLGANLALMGNAMMMLGGGYISLVVGFSLACLGFGLGRPGFSAGASLAAGAMRQSAVGGAVSAIAGASIVLPPILSVGLYEIWPAAPFILCCAALAVAGGYSYIHSSFSPAPSAPA